MELKYPIRLAVVAQTKRTTTATDADSDDSDESGDDSNQLDAKTHDERQDEKVITVSMSLKTWLELKAEMVRFTSMEEYGKEGLPAMWAFIENMKEKEGV